VSLQSVVAFVDKHHQRSQLNTLLSFFLSCGACKPHYSYSMTNVTAGQKRSWNDSETEANKRPRDKEEPKDWRDVYLKSPERNLPSAKQYRHDRRSPGRNDGGTRRRSDSVGRRRRDAEYSRYDRHPKDECDSAKTDRRREEPARSHSSSRLVEDEKEEGE
jgi:serine/threonine-protein kinase PRP4